MSFWVDSGSTGTPFTKQKPHLYFTIVSRRKMQAPNSQRRNAYDLIKPFQQRDVIRHYCRVLDFGVGVLVRVVGRERSIEKPISQVNFKQRIK